MSDTRTAEANDTDHIAFFIMLVNASISVVLNKQEAECKLGRSRPGCTLLRPLRELIRRSEKSKVKDERRTLGA